MTNDPADPTDPSGRWGPRDRSRADAMGLVLLLLGIGLHVSLLAILGPAGDLLALQIVVVAGQVLGAAVVASRRGSLPRAFWATVAIAVTPMVATVPSYYPRAAFLVLPVIFLLVLFSSAMLARAAARVVAAESIVVATWLLTRVSGDVGLVVLGMVFVVGTLAVLHAQLVQTADAHDELVARLERTASIDGLTGLLTRRAFEVAVAEEVRSIKAPSLLLVDVDHFKAVNDTYGHATGDAALRHICALLAAGVRAGDALIGRLGGDELAVLLPGCPQDVAVTRAAKLVQSVSETPLPVPGRGLLPLGISVGVAGDVTGGATALFAAADEALYAAKKAGRGRVHASAPASASLHRAV